MTRRTRRFLACGALATLWLSACSSREVHTSTLTPPPTGAVWVADEGSDSLSVLEAATGAVTATMTDIKGPHNVQVGRDGSVVYATSSAGTVVAIDPATYRVTAKAPTGPKPAHVIEAPNGKVYVTNAGDGTVSVYKGRGLIPAGKIRVDGMPHGMRAAANGSVIVVANMMDGALDLIDPATDKMLGAVPVGKSPVQVAVSADGHYAYTSLTDPPSVVKVDLSQRKTVGSTDVPNAPVQLYLTPDEKTVLCANQGTRENPGHTLSVIDTAAMTSRGDVTTGSGPHGVVIDTSGNWAWVTNSFDSTVSVVDVVNMSLESSSPVGAGPNGVSYSSQPPATAPANSSKAVAPDAVPGGQR